MNPLELRAPRTTRRGFLRLAGSAAAFAALAQIRVLPAPAAAAAAAGQRFFDPADTELLTYLVLQFKWGFKNRCHKIIPVK